MVKRRVPIGLILAALVCMAQSIAGSSSATVSDLLRQTGLSYQAIEEETGLWLLTYTGLANLDQVDAFVWERPGLVTMYITVFDLEHEPTKALLWRLLELNDAMAFFKYVIRGKQEGDGYYIDCQADLPLKSLTPSDFRSYLEELVLSVDENYEELKNLL